MSYNAFVTYAVLLALLHLPRPELKQRVVDSPDILSVIDQIPHLGSLLNSFYEGRYKELFTAIGARDRASAACAASPVTSPLGPVHLHPTLRRDPFLSEHSRFYVRELRVVAYTQFLEAYRRCDLRSWLDKSMVPTASRASRHPRGRAACASTPWPRPSA